MSTRGLEGQKHLAFHFAATEANKNNEECNLYRVAGGRTLFSMT